MRMLSLIRTVTMITLMALPVAAQAADAAGVNMATINIQNILRDSTAAKSAREQIDSKRDQYQGELKKIEDELRKEDQALAEQRSLLSQEALEQKRKEFRDKVTSAQKDVQQKKIRLDAAYAQALGDIQGSVMKIVESMAKAKGFAIVIPTSQLLYAIPSLDITPAVLAQLDKDLPKIKIDFNAPLPSAGKSEKGKE